MKPLDPGTGDDNGGDFDGGPLRPGTSVPGFRRALLAFFRRSARSLPWRDPPDPYAVLVSEIMLQQTRVETVIPYFERWMERFPDAETLAAAETEEVLHTWAGLGYYRRARYLHRAVREVVRESGGRIPEDPESLRRLPGVGEYTAAAVASIAFGARVAAVDGNVRRVLARLGDDPHPTPIRLRGWATRLLDPEDPGTFNQAMMELGALVCRPRGPQCGICPVGSFCRARASGTQEERPAPRVRREVPRVREAVAAIVRETGGRRQVLLRRRPDDGLLGGLWELPGVEVGDRERPGSAARKLARALLGPAAGRRGASGLEPGGALEPLEHAFTHRRVRYLPYLFRMNGEFDGGWLGEALRWVDETMEREIPLPTAQRTLLERVAIALAA